MAKHADSTGQSNIHVPYAFEFANAAARAAGTGYTLVPVDVGKFARQLDDNTFWMLSDDSPITWVAIGAVTVADARSLIAAKLYLNENYS
jgi:hypothetical protein